MSSKLEKVIEYIAHLDPGEKVSVRTLAQSLGVSEGTAYKGIKTAEAQGLVVTRPKTGTVRINLAGGDPGSSISLLEAARAVGAVCLCNQDLAMWRSFPAIVIGDGSIEQLRDAARRRSGNMLCVAGDRPDIYHAALELNMDLLLTGGSDPGPELLRIAERSGLCIFASEQDSFTLFTMLQRRKAAAPPSPSAPLVRDWMQLPRYLYTDDRIYEWHRLYSDFYYDRSSVCVVDDRMQICGNVNAQAAMTVSPATRLAEIMDPPESDSFVSEDLPMDTLAEQLILSQRSYVAVRNAEGLNGYIGLSDVVRYFLFHQNRMQFQPQADNGLTLRLDSDDPARKSRMYTVEITSDNTQPTESMMVNLLLSAASWHAHDVLGADTDFESGTFYAPVLLREPGEYNISSSIMKQTEASLILELELFSSVSSFLRCIITVSPKSARVSETI